MLCSLAYGGREGEPAGQAPALPRAFTDPARAEAEVLTPALDVFGLGALARFLAPDPPAGHVLAEVAEKALVAEPAARPSARSLAEVLQHDVPAARLPRGLAPPPPARPASRPADPLAAWRQERGGLGAHRRAARPRAGVVLVAVVAVAVVGGAVVLAGSAPNSAPALVTEPVDTALLPPPDEIRPGPTTTRAGLVPSTTTAAPTTTASSAARADCPPATAVLQADVDGDGCPEPVRYSDGILEAGSMRWALGQAGDQVATGDWACQGGRTVALFRPSTGELFRFDGWAEPGRDLSAVVVGRVPGGQALRAADVDRDGCHEVVVERGTGAAEVIRLPRVRR